MYDMQEQEVIVYVCQEERDEESCVYVSGRGFLSTGKQRRNGASLDEIRRMSNLLCLLLLLYFLFQRMFQLPLTYFGHMLGLNIRINRWTGMIVKSAGSELAISFLTNAVSLLVVFLLVIALYRGSIRQARVFRQPVRGLAFLAVPMTVSCGMLGIIAAFFFYQAMRFFGVVLYQQISPIRHLSPELVLGLVTTLFFAVFQELFFRGMLLAPLRRFGDGFAVIISAFLYCLWSRSAVEAVTAFVFGVCAAYFVVRSGSVLTAVYSRLLMLVLIYGFRMITGMLEPPLTAVVIMAVCLALGVWAVVACFRFVRLDPNAFRLIRPEGGLSTRSRLGAFCGTVGFLMLLVSLFLRTVSIAQIIG